MNLTNRTIQAVFILGVGILLGRRTTNISTVSAQVSSTNAGELLIGTVPVRLGMRKDVALGTLRKQYKLEESGEKLQGAEVWLIRSVDNITQFPGTVYFRQDRVVGTTRQWGQIEAEDGLVSFFQKFYGAFESASSDTRMGKLTCTISRKPDGNITHMLWDFGNRSVTFALAEGRLDGKPHNDIYVQEGVWQPQN
jgi:hypothetical protein